MKKLLSILKATMQGDMNIFKINLKKDEKSVNKKFQNAIIVVFLLCVLLTVSTEYAYMIAEPLSQVKMTFVMLTIFMVFASIMIFIEGLYKSQGILFESKDNDLLLSMPIKKSTILTARLIKLISFQYMFDFIFSVPAFAVYAYFEKPGYSYYILAIIMFILLPIIPTILSATIGYVIKMTSSMFKIKKGVQTVLSLAVTLGILALSMNMQTLMTRLAENATSINDAISKIYYPVGLFTQCIQQFEVSKLMILLGLNIILALAFITIFSILYFKILSKSLENYSKSNFRFKTNIFRKNSIMKALTNKEIKKYFSSPIYIINTIFGLILLLIMVIGLSFDLEGTINTVLKGQGTEEIATIIKGIFPKIFIIAVLVISPTVAITASSISLEGKSIELTKSLPVNAKKIFRAKIRASNIITIVPLLLISIIAIFTLGFKTNDIIQSLLICIIAPTFNAVFGLLMNLRFPILDSKNDAMVVKQSTSALISIFGGAVILAAPAIIYFIAELTVNVDLYTYICIALYTGITACLWQITKKYGTKRFQEL